MNHVSAILERVRQAVKQSNQSEDPPVPKRSRKRKKGSERHKTQRQILWDMQRGKCYWCGIHMEMPEPGTNMEKGSVPENLATIDHLDDKLSPERGKHPNERRRVLACTVCNNLRSNFSFVALESAQETTRKAHKEMIWARSKAYPASDPRGRGKWPEPIFYFGA